MNVLLETAFNRLLTKYERTFGEQPPFTNATAEEVIAHMRERLAAHENKGLVPEAHVLGATGGRYQGAGVPAVHG